MNDQAVVLLGQLAAKLGTTSEYLWTVLVRQAPVQSIITLGEYVLVAALLFSLYRFRAPVSGFFRAWADAEDFTAAIGIAISAIVLIVLVLSCLFSFSGMVTGFVNPEYWALNKILATIKAK